MRSNELKIVAELCQNHNGNFDLLRRMIDSAAAGGATHVKIQHIYAKNLVMRPEFEEGLVEGGTVKAIRRPWLQEFERLKGLELSDSECEKFVEHAQAAGLVPMTTCFAAGDIDRIVDQGFTVAKVASYDCASYPLLRKLSQKFDHLYVSTGATFDDELTHAARVLDEYPATFILLHCVTQYPTPLEAMNLRRLKWLGRFSPEVGFSDHSLVARDGLIAAKAAVHLGAEVIERHFTIDGNEDTKDGPISVNEDGIRELIDFAALSPGDQKAHLWEENSNWEVMLGRPDRWLSSEEMLNREYYRGRFGTPRREGAHRRAEMVFTWEETPV